MALAVLEGAQLPGPGGRADREFLARLLRLPGTAASAQKGGGAGAGRHEETRKLVGRLEAALAAGLGRGAPAAHVGRVVESAPGDGAALLPAAQPAPAPASRPAGPANGTRRPAGKYELPF